MNAYEILCNAKLFLSNATASVTLLSDSSDLVWKRICLVPAWWHNLECGTQDCKYMHTVKIAAKEHLLLPFARVFLAIFEVSDS